MPAAKQMFGPNQDAVELEIDATGSLYLPLFVSGVSVMGLIDTGSTVTVVHPSVLAMLSEDSEIPLNSETGRLRLADGSFTGSLGTVQLDLQLGTGKDIWSHVMVVAEIEAPVVIGIDFLRKYQCSLSMKEESLTVGGIVHS